MCRIVYAMSDIHGCLHAFEDALALVELRLSEPGTKLVLLGDYIDGGPDSLGVLERLCELEQTYNHGSGRTRIGEGQKVLCLLGNHEAPYAEDLAGTVVRDDIPWESEEQKKTLTEWIRRMPRYLAAGNVIFCHAGINEEAGADWESCTDPDTFVSKPYSAHVLFRRSSWREPVPPAAVPETTGAGIGPAGFTIVAGHTGTCTISGNPDYHDIWYEDASHIYIDGSTVLSGKVPVLKADLSAGRFYQVEISGERKLDIMEKGLP